MELSTWLLLPTSVAFENDPRNSGDFRFLRPHSLVCDLGDAL